MSETRKRPESDDAEEESLGVTDKRQRTLLMTDEDYYLEEFLAEFEIEEKEVDEAMKLLENEITSPNIKYCSSSCSMCSFLSSSSSFVLINRNEESCGPSISNDASSVMASIHFAGINISYFLGYNGDFPAWPLSFPTTVNDINSTTDLMNVVMKEVENEEIDFAGNEIINTCNNLDLDLEETDDEWIENILSEISFEFEE